MMTDIDRVHPFPAPAQELQRVVEEPWPEFGAVTSAALDVIDALRPIREPLSAEAEVVSFEGDDPYDYEVVPVARPHRLLVKAALPAGVAVPVVMREPVTATADALTRAAIAQWLADALAEAGGAARRHGEWTTLELGAGRCWVGPPGWRAGADEVRLRHGGGTLVVPIERDAAGAWLAGPRDGAVDQPPFAISFAHMAGLVTVQITRNYGYWLDAGDARDRLDVIVAQLRASGWDDARR
jgi:hypothetical protein